MTSEAIITTTGGAQSSEAVFNYLDRNRDGRIDRDELRELFPGQSGWVGASYESAGGRYDRYDVGSARYGSVENLHDGVYRRYYDSDKVIHTSSKSETDHYLSTTALDVYKDPNPRIVRRTDTASPVVHEQRISIRYLRPPTPPPPGPLIIQEIRPEQPPVPPPLIIQEHPPGLPQPPALVLRERPPTPPPRIPSEKTTRMLSPLPVPPRSVIIERFSAAPPKPRDIVIERWLPYGSRAKRETVVERAPSPIRYPEPTHTIILHEGGDARVVRKFDNLGVHREDPEVYRSRYGSSLLTTTTLVHEARNAGVTEDISAGISTASSYSASHGYAGDAVTRGYYTDASSGCYADSGHSSGTIRRTYISSDGHTREAIHGLGGVIDSNYEVYSRKPYY